MKYTPGPWKLEPWVQSFGPSYGPSDESYCAVRGWRVLLGDKHLVHIESEGNAHLIAAAPDLLEALRGLLRWVELVGYGNAACSNLARAAIAKAEGKKT